MQRSRMAEVETQSLYYVEIKIIINRVELKKGETWGRGEVIRERWESKNRKERKRNRQGCENIFIACVISDGYDHDRSWSDWGDSMIDQMGWLIDYDRVWSSNRVIDHDWPLGPLGHDPVLEEWVTCEYRVACHFHSWSKMWLKFSGLSHFFLDEYLVTWD